jgi:hypothetical protein
MFNNKKLIFVGPLGNPEISLLKKHDYVIRTNNFLSIKPGILKSRRCDILVVNFFYIRKYFRLVEANLDNIKYVIVPKGKYIFLKNKIDKKYHKKIISMSYNIKKHDFEVKGFPLMLSRFLYYILENHKPKLFYVTGIDFYESKKIEKFWLDGYSVPGDKQSKLMLIGKGKHNIESNKDFLLYLHTTYKWIRCDIHVRRIINKSKPIRKAINIVEQEQEKRELKKRYKL